MQVVVQQADVVDPDLVAERLEHVQVGMGATGGATGVAEQLAGEGERRGLLADARRAMEQIGVRGAVSQRRLEQALGLVLLANAVEHGG